MKIINLDNIILVVEDLEKSVSFYQEIGFKLVEHHVNQIAILQFGNERIRLLLHPLSDNMSLPPDRAAAFYGFEIDDIHKMHATFSSREFRITEIRDQPWGVKEFYLTDPNGHVFAFFERN